MLNEHVIPNISHTSVKVSHLGHHRELKRLSLLHYHDEVELYACRCGMISAVVDNVKYYVRGGEALFFNARVPHETFCEVKGSQSMYLQFKIQDFLPTPSEDLAKFITYLRRNATETVHLIKDPAILNAMCAIYDEQKKKRAGYINMIHAHVHTICAILAREKIFSYDFQGDMQSFRKLLPALTYVDQNFSSALSLDDVSAAAGLNKFYFCRLFKSVFGIGFSEYLNLVRVFKAEKMLKETDKTVLEIAFDTGFSSVSYFNSIFKKHKGCTPTACRNAVNFNT